MRSPTSHGVVNTFKLDRADSALFKRLVMADSIVATPPTSNYQIKTPTFPVHYLVEILMDRNLCLHNSAPDFVATAYCDTQTTPGLR
ncbi:hypothetical protein Zmor_013036 [Zophobas morio]|uniref:Uncharacterized protein n=1 Tax=Zophobas morio TaxID=2755281 RepID=A0AA38IA10_9CUCU|nr:hypothetical protein Zmor_013036 [Zophobas morio]